MSEREAFERKLADDPLDVATRLVFADWLEENGSPREAKAHRDTAGLVEAWRSCMKGWFKRRRLGGG